jgi:integrase
MKKIRVRVTHDKNSPTAPWCVSRRVDGKRSRRFFATKKEAAAYADLLEVQLENLGRRALDLSNDVLIGALKCTELLAPRGKSIEDAVLFYIGHLQNVDKSLPLGDLMSAFMRTKEAKGKSKRHLADLQSRIGMFVRTYPDMVAADVTTIQVDDWLQGLHLSPQSQNNFRAALHNLFSFAVKRGHCAENPVHGVDKAKVVRGAPGILKPREVAKLLLCAPEDLVSFVAIGAFAGLRPSEIERLQWDHIDFVEHTVEVAAKNSKNAQRRHVVMSDNLKRWLSPLAKQFGPVTPKNSCKKLIQARKAAGIEMWPHDALRHSFASYHLAFHRDQNELSAQLGHQHTGMLYQHYRQLVTKKEAANYWNINPPSHPCRQQSAADRKAA